MIVSLDEIFLTDDCPDEDGKVEAISLCCYVHVDVDRKDIILKFVYWLSEEGWKRFPYPSALTKKQRHNTGKPNKLSWESYDELKNAAGKLSDEFMKNTDLNEKINSVFEKRLSYYQDMIVDLLNFKRKVLP